MRIKTTSLLAAAAVTALMTSSASAALITYSFNSNSAAATTNELSGDGVTADPAVASAGSEIANNYWRRTLTPDAARTVSFTLDIGATPIDLTGLSFVDGIDSNSGSNQTYSVITLSVTTTGSETPGLSEDTFTHTLVGTGETSNGNSVTLSGLDNLTNVEVTFEFSVLYGTGVDGTGGNNSNRWATIDDVQITGAPVPEPGSLALMGLGGLCVLRRRRH